MDYAPVSYAGQLWSTERLALVVGEAVAANPGVTESHLIDKAMEAGVPPAQAIAAIRMWQGTQTATQETVGGTNPPGVMPAAPVQSMPPAQIVPAAGAITNVAPSAAPAASFRDTTSSPPGASFTDLTASAASRIGLTPPDGRPAQQLNTRALLILAAGAALVILLLKR